MGKWGKALIALALTAVTACGGEGTSDDRGGGDLDSAAKKDIAMRLISSAENSSLDWRAQFSYIEDIDDGRGWTAGIVGFCSGCGDMTKLVERYTEAVPDNALAPYLPALREAEGSDTHEGLGADFTAAWREAAKDKAFRDAQEAERDRVYFTPAVKRAKADGLGALGQFVYFDAYVMHGHGDAPGNVGFRTMRENAVAKEPPPSKGGDEEAYLDAFLDARVTAIAKEPSHTDTTRIETAQRVFLREGNLALDPPLKWKVYGETFRIDD